MIGEFEISHFDEHFGSQDEAVAKTGLKGWSNLVMKGYGFEGDSEYANLQFNIEYAEFSDIKLTVLHKEGIVVASLGLRKTTHFPGYNSFGVNGIVVLPELQGRGIGKLLYREAAKSPEVEIIAGSTKSPSAVIARSKGTAEAGMRTFFGYSEVTSEACYGISKSHINFLETYLLNKENGNPSNPIVLKSIDILLPNIPDLSKSPIHIREAFTSVVLKQMELKNTKTAVMPLISIKENLLND